MNRSNHHQHMARVYLAEARRRHDIPAQREHVSTLVRWARDRHHRHIKARRAGQLGLNL